MTARLRVLAEAAWPEPGDGSPPPVPGLVYSSFSPLVAAVADRCLGRREPAAAPERAARTAVVVVSASGDADSAEHVAATVAAGGRPGPLFFFQSVPNSVAGHVTGRWGLRGPVVCVSPVGEPMADGLAEAELLIDDDACDEALVVLVEQRPQDCAAAVLVTRTGETR